MCLNGSWKSYIYDKFFFFLRNNVFRMLSKRWERVKQQYVTHLSYINFENDDIAILNGFPTYLLIDDVSPEGLPWGLLEIGKV